MALRNPIDAIIFDLDGVLLDTEPLYTLATGEVIAEFGKTYEWALKCRVMGSGPLEAAELVTRELGLPLTAEEYVLRTDRVLERLFSSTPAMPGAEELVSELLGSRFSVGLATSTAKRLYSVKARPHAWLSRVPVTVCGDDPEVKAAKPAPDIFWVAAERLGVAPARCVVVEDSANGVLAAKRAGMQVIAIPDPRLEHPILKDAELVVTSHTEVRAALSLLLG